MNNYQWLLQMDGAERKAWFDAEHVETEERALDGDTEPENEDSRERLEAEIDEWAAVMNLEGYQLDMIHGWLNRRAKIMERKMVEMNQRYFDCVEQEKKIAELQAKVDELTQVAESKRLSFADRIRFVNEIDELKAERGRYREKFGKCLDYADAIHALMDDEGMA